MHEDKGYITMQAMSGEIVWPPAPEKPVEPQPRQLPHGFLRDLSNSQLRMLVYVQLRILGVIYLTTVRAIDMALKQEEQYCDEYVKGILDDTKKWTEEQETKLNNMLNLTSATWEDNVRELLRENEELREQLHQKPKKKPKSGRWRELEGE